MIELPLAAFVRTAVMAFLIVGATVSLVTTGMAVAQTPASEAGATNDSTQPTSTSTSIQFDPKHPPRIIANNYTAESIKNYEEGVCYVSILVDTNGQVPALQLVQSTGYPRLDGSCLVSYLGVRMIPATKNGQPIASWKTMTVAWHLRYHPKFEPRPPLADAVAPRIPEDEPLEVGADYYPAEARKKKLKGVCIVQLSVDATGAVTNTLVIRSSGSRVLDDAPTSALSKAKFTPKKEAGVPVDSPTLMAVMWHLP